MSEIAWGAKVSPEFMARMFKTRDNFGWDNDRVSKLMGCMGFESAATFSPSIKNAAGSGATGLIQFMPNTAIDLGTTVALLSKMTPVKQLDYVEKYFKPYAKRCHSLSDMYMAILLPKYVGMPEDSVLFFKGISYRQNSGLDTNKDGKVTKAEAAAKVYAVWQKGLLKGNSLTVEG